MKTKRIAFMVLSILLLVGALLSGQTFGGNNGAKLFNLSVIANVSGAQVSINGNQINGTSIKLPQGSYQVAVSAPGYSDFTTTVSLNGNAVVRANLVASGFNLSVNSNVSNATVYINDSQVGSTGGSFSLPAGTYNVRVSAPGYRDFISRISLNGNQTINANLLTANFNLSISSNVRDARVSINDSVVGTPGSSFSLPPGTYRVKVSAPGYSEFTTTVQLNGNASVNANLTAATFNLRIISNVQGAQVYINNNQVGTNETVYQLERGAYDVRVSAPGYQDFTTRSSLNGNQVLRVNLIPANGTLVIELPGRRNNGQENGYNGDDRRGGLKILVDGATQEAGSMTLSLGQHKVRFELGELRAETTVTISQGQTVVVRPELGIIVK